MTSFCFAGTAMSSESQRCQQPTNSRHSYCPGVLVVREPWDHAHIPASQHSFASEFYSALDVARKEIAEAIPISKLWNFITPPHLAGVSTVCASLSKLSTVISICSANAKLALSSTLLASVAVYSIQTANAAPVVFTAPDAVDDALFGVSVAIQGERVLIGSTGSGTRQRGEAYMFDLSGSLLQTFEYPNATPFNPQFGSAVALDGNHVLVSASNDRTSTAFHSGTVNLFNATTAEHLLTLSDPLVPSSTFSSPFGRSIAIQENNIVVGDPGNSSAGRAKLFDLQGILQTEFSAPNFLGESFGSSVAIDGERVVISDIAFDNGKGAAFLFDTDGTLLHTFENPSLSPGRNFGTSVAIDGGSILIGAARNNSSSGTENVGQAFLFNVDGELLSTFDDPAPVVSVTNTSVNNSFGLSVGIDGTNVVIGRGNPFTVDPLGGAAYLFDTAGNLQSIISNPSPDPGDAFGTAVGIDGGNIVVGAYRDDEDGSNVGRAYLEEVFNEKATLYINFGQENGFFDLPILSFTEFLSPAANLDGDQIEFVLSSVRSIFSEFNIEVVSTLPSDDREYSTIIVGGSPSTVLGTQEASAARLQNSLGIADAVDPGNRNPEDRALVFSDNPLFSGEEGLLVLALTIAHEGGHLFGLPHVADSMQLMHPTVGSASDNLISDELFNRAEFNSRTNSIMVLPSKINLYRELGINVGLSNGEKLTGNPSFNHLDASRLAIFVPDELTKIFDLSIAVFIGDDVLPIVYTVGDYEGGLLNFLVGGLTEYEIALFGSTTRGGPANIFFSPTTLSSSSGDSGDVLFGLTYDDLFFRITGDNGDLLNSVLGVYVANGPGSFEEVARVFIAVEESVAISEPSSLSFLLFVCILAFRRKFLRCR